MKKILILGGNSDIGTKLIDKLIEIKDYRLHVHYNKKFQKNIDKSKVKLIKKDLLNINRKNIKIFFDNNYDIIINLVGYVSNQSFFKFDIKETQKTILINSLIPLLIIKNSIQNMIKKNMVELLTPQA